MSSATRVQARAARCAIMTLNVRHSNRVHVRAAAPRDARCGRRNHRVLAGEVPEREPVSVSVAPARALGDRATLRGSGWSSALQPTGAEESRSSQAGEGRSGGKGACQGAERVCGLTSRLSQEPPAVPQPQSLRRISAPRRRGPQCRRRCREQRCSKGVAGCDPMQQPPACRPAADSVRVRESRSLPTMLPLRFTMRCPERLRVRKWTLARGQSCLPTSCCHPN